MTINTINADNEILCYTGASISPQPREEVQDTTRLEALEKSLQAASESIMASSAPSQQQLSQSAYQTSSYQTSSSEQHQAVVRHESRAVESHGVESRAVESQQTAVSSPGDAGPLASHGMSMQHRSGSPSWDNVAPSNVYVCTWFACFPF